MKDPNYISPLHENAVHESAWKHVTGRAKFVNDMELPKGCLVSHIIASPVAHGRITRLDVSEALKVEGVVAVLTAKNIPGVNDVSAA